MTIYEWYKKYIQISSIDVSLIKEHIKTFKYNPKISLITTLYNTKIEWVKECIESVKSQFYDNWELCICDNGSTNPEVKECLNNYVRSDDRIKVWYETSNLGISDGTNKALDTATGDFCGILDSDDYLSSLALYLVVNEINNNLDANYIYTDQVHVDENNKFIGAYFKPDFSPHLICSQNYITHFSVYKSEVIKNLKMRSEFNGSQDYDLTLRAIDSIPHRTIYHIPYLAYHFRRHKKSEGTARESYAIIAATNALKEHIQRMGYKADVSFHWPWYRVRYQLDEWPHVDIVIVSMNKDGMLFNCLNNLLAKTNYSNYTIYLCVPEQVKELFSAKYGALVNNGLIKFVPRTSKEEYNYSLFANRSVELCDGPLICLMNDDIEPIEDNWLREMVPYAQQKNVGVVGTKLLYPNMTIQHVGVVLGISSEVCNHIFKGKHCNFDGYYGKNRLISNCSVVTGACSIVRKEVYKEVNGYEEELKVAYNDVDFCLKLLKNGYFNVINPYSLMIHYEAFTRGPDQTKIQLDRFADEISKMKKRWGNLLKSDPFYNPNLALETDDYQIAETSRFKKPWLQ